MMYLLCIFIGWYWNAELSDMAVWMQSYPKGIPRSFTQCSPKDDSSDTKANNNNLYVYVLLMGINTCYCISLYQPTGYSWWLHIITLAILCNLRMRTDQCWPTIYSTKHYYWVVEILFFKDDNLKKQNLYWEKLLKLVVIVSSIWLPI